MSKIPQNYKDLSTSYLTHLDYYSQYPPYRNLKWTPITKIFNHKHFSGPFLRFKIPRLFFGRTKSNFSRSSILNFGHPLEQLFKLQIRVFSRFLLFKNLPACVTQWSRWVFWLFQSVCIEHKVELLYHQVFGNRIYNDGPTLKRAWIRSISSGVSRLKRTIWSVCTNSPTEIWRFPFYDLKFSVTF